jgi:hypothetical protein
VSPDASEATAIERKRVMLVGTRGRALRHDVSRVVSHEQCKPYVLPEVSSIALGATSKTERETLNALR